MHITIYTVVITSCLSLSRCLIANASELYDDFVAELPYGEEACYRLALRPPVGPMRVQPG